MANSTEQQPAESENMLQEEESVQASEQYYTRFIPSPQFVENLEMYAPGGYHPVNLKDHFEGRYTVVHKLGSGGSSTVWLANDKHDKRYVALKIVASSMSKEAETEVAVHRRLQAEIDADTLNTFLVPLLDEFWIDGPNGRHLCLVQAVCGPSLSSFREARRMKIRPDLGPVLSKQLVKALQRLHQAGVVFGDLSSGNVVFSLSSLDEYSVEELYQFYGEPVGCPVTPVRESDGKWAKKHAPATVYDNIDFTKLSILHALKPKAQLIDLGGAYILPKRAQDEGIQFTESYADAECLYHGSDMDQRSDIWALACIIYELRSARCLFEDHGIGVWRKIVARLGPVPKAWTGEAGESNSEGSTSNTLAVNEAEQDPNDKEVQGRSMRKVLMRFISKLIALKTLKSIFKHLVTLLASKKPIKCPTSAAQLTETQTVEPEQPEPKFHWEGEDATLQGQVNNIGNWHPWHRMTIEQRRERLYAWNKVFDDNVDISDNGLDRGPPPHSKLSEEEAKHLGDLLARMLTWERTERMSLGEVLEHPWLNTKYVNDNKGEWLQWYYQGCGYEGRGAVFI